MVKRGVRNTIFGLAALASVGLGTAYYNIPEIIESQAKKPARIAEAKRRIGDEAVTRYISEFNNDPRGGILSAYDAIKQELTGKHSSTYEETLREGAKEIRRIVNDGHLSIGLTNPRRINPFQSRYSLSYNGETIGTFQVAPNLEPRDVQIVSGTRFESILKSEATNATKLGLRKTIKKKFGG